MTRRCMITGKMPLSGNNVSHANNRTRRRFMPNVQENSVYSETLARRVSIRVSSAGLRTLERKGGLDQFLRTTPKSKLDPALHKIKAQVEKAKPEKSV